MLHSTEQAQLIQPLISSIACHKCGEIEFALHGCEAVQVAPPLRAASHEITAIAFVYTFDLTHIDSFNSFLLDSMRAVVHPSRVIKTRVRQPG